MAGRGRVSTSGGQERGSMVRANVAQATATTQAEATGPAFRGDKSIVPDLNPNQWQSLLKIINSHKANSTENMTGKIENVPWIIHTVASNHMTKS